MGVEDRTQWRAACRFHRWYGSWRVTRYQAEQEQTAHDRYCVPEMEGWSETVGDRWRAVMALIEDARMVGFTVEIELTARDLRHLSEDQRLAVLDGILAIPSR